MAANKVVRVIVDVQHGFAHPEGGLYVKGAEKILPNVVALVRDAEARGLPIIGSVDTHEAHSKEFAVNGGIWPVHCVKGTQDWLMVPSVLPAKFHIVAAADYDASHPMYHDNSAAVFFEKDIYSMFDNQNAVPVVERFIREGYEFEVCGIATDYCVKAAALGIRDCGGKVTIISDACEGVTPEGVDAAIGEMKKAGIAFRMTADAIA